MNVKVLLAVSTAIVAVVVICAALVIVGGDDENEVPVTPDIVDPIDPINPMDTNLSDLPIGSVLKWEVSGTYTSRGIVYDLTGDETYEVVSKDSKSISFKVNGIHYAVYGSWKQVISKSNDDIKTWDLTDDHTPYEVGELDTEFGVQKVKVVDWIIPDTTAGYKITNQGSKQYWGYDNGFGLLQRMAYSIDSTGEVVFETKTLVSVEIK